MNGNQEARLRVSVKKIACDLVRLQRDAADAGLYATMHAINDASKKLGWEAAGRIEKTRRGK